MINGEILLLAFEKHKEGLPASEAVFSTPVDNFLGYSSFQPKVFPHLPNPRRPSTDEN